ncbi:uncharacterized protein FIBRA_08609 [Fibroporia radiculosa]|uniref:Histone deacetylase complex subunit SAP30 Sin3 binding domain-containing protein n=1 Tax=Fibroporia radiculosa TaxID=599839 RepID=J4I316_9APHY|nr:uncharacterized protein FIBRA_08609 [Fibroporia radiculosa]CCM06352.1 predicted protein [Fibroporia radiculosa]
MTPTTQQTAAAAPTSATVSRSRPQGSRRKANAQADDAAYHAPASSAAGTKRAAADKAEGEPRVKRKRVDGAAGVSASTSGNAGISVTSGPNAARKERLGSDGEASLVDFSTLPLSVLHEYLVQFDLVPDVDPSPLIADDPPPPSSLLRPRGHGRRHASTASPAPSLSITPANRPRRDVTGRRRSARLIEDERGSELSVVPILADGDDVHGMLAAVAQRHFREHAVKEVDTLASFMYAVRAKGESWRSTNFYIWPTDLMLAIVARMRTEPSVYRKYVSLINGCIWPSSTPSIVELEHTTNLG